MTTDRHRRLYRGLTRLYPAAFRGHYDDDLVQHFSDLFARDGARRAWARTALDLAITVPQYRLETIMNTRLSTTALNVLIAALVAGGALSFLIGLYPGAILIVIAAVIAATQRTQLARSLRTPAPNRRRWLFTTSAVLAFLCVGLWVSYLNQLSDNEISTRTLLLHSGVGTLAMVGALACFIIALLTPRSHAAQR